MSSIEQLPLERRERWALPAALYVAAAGAGVAAAPFVSTRVGFLGLAALALLVGAAQQALP